MYARQTRATVPAPDDPHVMQRIAQGHDNAVIAADYRIDVGGKPVQETRLYNKATASTTPADGRSTSDMSKQRA